MTKANEMQVGGDHYKAHGSKDIQHWDVVKIFNLDYFQGNITKYVFRWRDKRGIEDLKKARHYLDKYIEQAEEEAVLAMQASASPVLSQAMDQRARSIEWDEDRDGACEDGCSNIHPAEPGMVMVDAPDGSDAETLMCPLCGQYQGRHAPTCDRSLKPALLYTGAGQPLVPVDPHTLAPLPLPTA